MSIKIFTVQEMVAAEKAADAAGVTYEQMMETAGRLVAQAIIDRYPVADVSILVLVGPGNNGGDGLVAGRYLAEAGANVAFYLFKPRDPQIDTNYQRVMEMGLFVVEAEQDQRFRVFRTRLNITDILIDALLGTGVTRPITGNLAELLKQVQAGLRERVLAAQPVASLTSLAQVGSTNNGQAKPQIVAVDCPSGLNCDTGAIDPLAIPADLTVTFAGPKRGHFRFPGAQTLGELVAADINIPTYLPEVKNVALEMATVNMARSLLPARANDGHKGTFGTAMIAAGSEHYWGAPVLAAKGAYRVGAGLVALLVPADIRSTVAGQLPEATYPPVPAVSLLDASSASYLMENAAVYKGILVGPGLSAAKEFLAALFQSKRSNMADFSRDLIPPNGPIQDLPPLVIDADGLNILAGWSSWYKHLPQPTILTPHPGEMARLMNTSLAEVKATDRVDLARKQAEVWGHIVLLKGAFTIVAAPDGRATLLPFANPLLAVGGSGDVLAGIIVGLLAQGLQPYEAAVLGAYLHGAAAELASVEFGRAGLLAGELADWLPLVRQRLEE